MTNGPHIPGAAALLMLVAPCARALEFERLGDLPGGIFQSTVDCVSSNGLFIGGQGNSSRGFEGFRWSEADGFLAHGDPPNSPFNSATRGIDNSGLVAAGRVTIGTANGRAARWVPEFEYYSLPTLNTTGFRFGSANAISDDGLKLVGQTSARVGTASVGRAFFWSSNTGGTIGTMLNLGTLQGNNNTFSNAHDISGDGTVVVGSSTLTITEPADDPDDPPIVIGSVTEAFRWTAADGMVGLGDFGEEDSFSEALGTSTDGRIIVGVASIDDPTPEDDEEDVDEGGPVGFVLFDGVMESVGDLPGGIVDSRLRGVSDDGWMAVGFGTDAGGRTAVLWDPENGLRKLSGLLAAAGVDLEGWTLTGAADISADGDVIVGNAINPGGFEEAWRITGARELLLPAQYSGGPGTELEVEVGAVASFDTVADDLYQLEFSDDAGGSWLPLGAVHDTVGMATPTPHHVIDPSAPAEGRSYRVRLLAGSASVEPPEVVLSEGTVLSFRSVPGLVWQVEFSPALDGWSELAPAISSIGDRKAFDRSLAHPLPQPPDPERPRCLYRLVIDGEIP